jgi:hypothetical protein
MPQRLWPMEPEIQNPIGNSRNATEDNNNDASQSPRDSMPDLVEVELPRFPRVPRSYETQPGPYVEDVDEEIPYPTDFARLFRQTAINTEWIAHELPEFKERMMEEFGMLSVDLANLERAREQDSLRIAHMRDEMKEMSSNIEQLVAMVNFLGAAMEKNNEKLDLLEKELAASRANGRHSQTDQNLEDQRANSSESLS